MRSVNQLEDDVRYWKEEKRIHDEGMKKAEDMLRERELEEAKSKEGSK